MRRRITVDGVEVQYGPGAPIEKVGTSENPRQRFERGVKKSWSAIWTLLTAEGTEFERACKAIDDFQKEDK